MSENHAILTTPFDALGLSNEFLEMANANGFTCINDILNNGLSKLPHLPKSGYRMMRELVNLMDANGLLRLTM